MQVDRNHSTTLTGDHKRLCDLIFGRLEASAEELHHVAERELIDDGPPDIEKVRQALADVEASAELLPAEGERLTTVEDNAHLLRDSIHCQVGHWAEQLQWRLSSPPEKLLAEVSVSVKELRAYMDLADQVGWPEDAEGTEGAK